MKPSGVIVVVLVVAMAVAAAGYNHYLFLLLGSLLVCALAAKFLARLMSPPRPAAPPAPPARLAPLRPRPRFCPRCGVALTGQVGDTCLRCGKRFDTRLPSAQERLTR
jgi:hypothetical protein